MREKFEDISEAITTWTGSPWASLFAVSAIVIWAASGPLLGFSDTWQLIVNTATTLITFIMVFLIQASQNRSDAALQLKLDELLRAQQGAPNEDVGVEEKTEAELKERKTQVKQEARSEGSN